MLSHLWRRAQLSILECFSQAVATRVPRPGHPLVALASQCPGCPATPLGPGQDSLGSARPTLLWTAEVSGSSPRPGQPPGSGSCWTRGLWQGDRSSSPRGSGRLGSPGPARVRGCAARAGFDVSLCARSPGGFLTKCSADGPRQLSERAQRAPQRVLPGAPTTTCTHGPEARASDQLQLWPQTDQGLVQAAPWLRQVTLSLQVSTSLSPHRL